jgi:DNA-binding response OmpR family regulator
MAKILVVDDDPSIRQLLTDVLELDGHEIHLAVDGNDGLRLLELTRPDFVVLDVMMPGIDGYDVLKVIRSQEGDPLPVLMLTASADPGSAARGWVDGVDYYLAKPFTPDVVLDIVDSVCGQRIATTDGAGVPGH